ncbi:Proteasome maturation protein [Smittium mucronatum]|uniref:Proteasome maturation protein n=1 Tax=Smittium mucronatum TaxID=133383 RepID=A0A1R0H1P7_9FUNG|nr:Proteasome maturation protein [Smittium mucronatum]
MSQAIKFNDYGVNDTITNGPKRIDQTLDKVNEFETHLMNIKLNKLESKLEFQKQTFGSHMPLRTILELHSVSKPNRPVFLTPSSNLHLDILNGDDETINVEDILFDESERENLDVHSTIIKNLRL